MRLDKIELKGLQDMIFKTSQKTIEKYKLENINQKEEVTLFLGDSMIEYFKVNDYFPKKYVLNRGIAGATTKLIIENIDNILGSIKTNKIFISIGSNDLILLEEKEEKIKENIKKVFEVLNERFHNPKIYYLSTTPVVKTTSKVYKKIYVAGRTNEENKKINEFVQSLIRNYPNIEFINQFDELTDEEGYLKEDLTPDGIHLNKKGYDIYSLNIKKYI
ncbi:GDSL-type esterase/lipase family protein [Acholeplasma equifetale]|uniref:GDSL-type esterase/lipase family protein n=1 Tax=Acholeplasma equifetale TaxID=264634 RepID=UPI00047DA125|nr:GDSL-type esterase/lipase family protein [Acholeplasma equifetale]